MSVGLAVFVVAMVGAVLLSGAALVVSIVYDWMRRERRREPLPRQVPTNTLTVSGPPMWPLHDPDEDDATLVRPYYRCWERRRARLDEIAALAAVRATSAIQELTAAAEAEAWGRS